MVRRARGTRKHAGAVQRTRVRHSLDNELLLGALVTVALAFVLALRPKQQPRACHRQRARQVLARPVGLDAAGARTRASHVGLVVGKGARGVRGQRGSQRAHRHQQRSGAGPARGGSVAAYARAAPVAEQMAAMDRCCAAGPHAVRTAWWCGRGWGWAGRLRWGVCNYRLPMDISIRPSASQCSWAIGQHAGFALALEKHASARAHAPCLVAGILA